MLKRLIYRLFERRHFWRYADFSEIAELYASRMLRTMAVSMVSVFVAIYLYQNGYHLRFIMGYFALYFLLRALLVFPAAFTIARIGPKHANLISNLLYVPSLLMLTQLPGYGLAALIGFGVFQAASVALYDVAHLVNFSKVRHAEHVGKELSFMYVMERLGTSLSPVLGGLIAFWLGPQATMIFAAGIFALAAVPLLFTPEPVRTHQTISFKHFNWRDTWRGILASTAVGADFIISGSVWSLYVAIAIFGTTDNAVYAQIGALLSVTILTALIFARIFGLLIDRRVGGRLLTISVVTNMVSHLSRGLVHTPTGIVAINVVNEAATTGYMMPFAKGMFDQADRLPGYRIVYLALQSIATALGAGLMACIVIGLSFALPTETQAMQTSFIVVAGIVLLIARHRFPALNDRAKSG